jgi:hypothetical protein
MARSGSENRQRPVTLKARFTREEAALVTEQAARAGVSVAAVIRYAVLDQKPLRASRKPGVDAALAAQLLGRLGQCAAALRQAAEAGNPSVHASLIEATHRDLGEMRNVLFEALGLEP